MKGGIDKATWADPPPVVLCALKSTVHIPVITYHCQWSRRGCEQPTARDALHAHLTSLSRSPWAKSCLTCDCMDCSLPGSPVHGVSQARVLEWVAISFSRASSSPREWTQVSCIADRFFFFFFLPAGLWGKLSKWIQMFQEYKLIQMITEWFLLFLVQWYCGCFHFKHTTFLAV